MPSYHYSTLSLGPEGIRLLRILPHKDKAAPIQCQLINYSLEESDEGNHLYEALSYVWGDPSKTLPILVDGQVFDVTVNLHGALLRLRSSQLERVIWIDAICINQTDNSEKEHQIKLMTKIYGHANRVIVWLGDAADNSDQAFQDISAAAGSKDTVLSKTKQSAILKLLARPWFRRIWVLQEVAAARHVLIMCGPSKISGYIFCLGLDGLELSYRNHPSLHGLICSMIYILRDTVSRPAYTENTLKRGYLAELIDMYHSREASLPHDKVYALLNMSFDGPTAASLSPNYKTPWRDLFQQLIEFLLPKEASVRTWSEKGIAVIKSKGCILGRVSQVEADTARHDRQVLSITFKNKPRSLVYKEKWGERWTLQASAKSVLPGDLVCHLQGAPLPTIIRMCEDHFAVIRIIISPQEPQHTDSSVMKKPRLLWKKNFPRDFLLMWNWGELDKNLRDEERYDASAEAYVRGLEDSAFGLNKATRLYNLALVIGDMGENEIAAEWFQAAIEGYGEPIAETHPHKMADRENTALIHKNAKRWREAEDTFLKVIQEKRLLYREGHPEILNSIAGLISTFIGRDCNNELEHNKAKDPGARTVWMYAYHTYTSRFYFEDTERAEDLPWRIRDNLPIPEEQLVSIAQSSNAEEILRVLFEQRVNGIHMTENVVEAAARNKHQATELMRLFLDHKGSEIRITGKVLEGVMQNSKAKEITELLLEQRGGEIPITAVIKHAADWSSGMGVIELLVKTKGYHLQITEEIVKIVLGGRMGYDVMQMLFRERRDEIQITEGILKVAAMSRDDHRLELMELLLKWGKKVQITEGVVLEVARTWQGYELMRVLLRERGSEVRITEEVVKAAAGSGSPSDDEDTVMRLLLTEREDEIQITEGVVEAAVSNISTMKPIELLLANQRNEIRITERVVQAASGSYYGDKVLTMLLERQRNDIHITEEMVKATSKLYNRDEEIMELLLEQRGNEIAITPAIIGQITVLFGARMISRLLDQGDNNIKITEELLEAAVGAESRRSATEAQYVPYLLHGGGGVMNDRANKAQVFKAESWRHEAGALKQLFEYEGKTARITDEIVKAAAGNTYRGREVMELLFEQWGDNIQITEGVLQSAAGNTHLGPEVTKLLFKQWGHERQITEEALKAAAYYNWQGKAVMELIFERRRDEIEMTEGVIRAAAGNDKEVMRLLVEQWGDGMQITEGILEAAAGNACSGDGVLELLFEHWADDIQITEGVLKVAAGNTYRGREVMELLFKQRRGGMEITEGVIRAAAGNQTSGKEVLRVLVEQRGNGI